MNAQVTLSTKGQVVIPKDVRDQLGLMPGQALDVIPMGGGVLLTPQIRKSGRTFEQITADIRKHYVHEGPPISIEDMDAAVDQMFRDRKY